MATFAFITPLGGAEPCAHFVPTPVSRGFTRLNSALARYIDCERDLDGAHCFDPAFLDWMVDAEAARSTVLDCIAAVAEAPVARESDKPLQRSAVLTRALIDSETGAQFTGLYRLLGSHPSFFACPDNDVIGQMLQAHQEHLRALADLGEFAAERDVPDDARDDSARIISVFA